MSGRETRGFELNIGGTSPLRSKIVAETLVDKIEDRLVTALALGLYVQHQQLPPERELAATLGVSRVTMREALGRLVDAGYVEVRRGRNGGHFVRADWGPGSAVRVQRLLGDDWQHFEDLFDARSLLEPLIAHTAASRCTEEFAVLIREAVQAYVDAQDHEASRLADAELHYAIALAAQNPLLLGLSQQLRTQVSLNLGAEPYSDEVRRAAIEQHRRLSEAVIEGRSEEAAKIAAEHFAMSERLIRELIQRAQSTEEQ